MKKFNLRFFNFNNDNKDRFSYDFPVEIEHHANGEVSAACPSIPGARAQGKSEKEALERLRSWMGRYFQTATAAPFERCEVFPDHPKVYSLLEHRGHLYASTNRDTVLKSGGGSAGSWKAFTVTNNPSRFFNASADAGYRPPVAPGSVASGAAPIDPEAGDYVTQIYCLARYAPLGQEASLFAGTNLNGSVFRSEDGETWREAFATGEDRVHALCVFKDRLYAGTSSEGRVYAYDGSQWNAVGALNETAVTALGSFGGYLWAGTYPSGLLFASSNGFAWEEVALTGHAFVQCFKEFKDAFYAGVSSPRGAAVLRTRNGRDWETVYESPRELNLFCLEVFDGQLWAGTGNSGRVLASHDGEKWRTVFAGDDEGVRSLAVFDDFLWAGTENGGAVLKSTRDSAQLPNIENICVAEVTSSTAVLTWDTDLTCTSEVQYAVEEPGGGGLPLSEVIAAGEAGGYPYSVLDRIPKRRHRAKLAGLKAGTKYRFRVVCLNRRSSTTVVDGLNFSTPSVTRPKVDSTTHPESGAWSRNDSPEVHIFSEGRVAGWRWVLDREPTTLPEKPRAEFTESGRVSFSRLADGPWWFHAVSVDENGNSGEEAAHYSILIDTSAPVPINLRSSTHPAPGDWRADPSPVVEWDAPEDLSGIKGYYVKVDRDPGTVPGTHDGTFTASTRFESVPLEDGVWYVHVATVDEAGNHGSEAAHWAVRIDTQAVAPSLTSPTHPREDRWFPVREARIDWAPPHDLSGVAGYLWCLDREPKTLPAEGASSFAPRPHLDLEGLADGVWYVHVRTVDKAGNVSRDGSHLALKVDTTADPPWVESPTHPEDHCWYNKRSAVMTWRDPIDDSGVEGYYYAVDQEAATVPTIAGGAFTPERSLSFEVPKDGLWYFHIVLKDKAGNVGKRAAHFPLRVDTVVGAPGLTSRTHPDGEVWTNQAVASLQFTPPEDLSGVAAYLYYVTEEEAAPFDPRRAMRSVSTEVEARMPHDGVHWVLAACEDNAGNVSRSPARLKLRLDTVAAPPTLKSPTHTDPAKWYGSLKFELYVTDGPDLSGIDGYWVIFNRDEIWTPDLGAMRYTQARGSTVTVPSDGVWWAHVVAKDKAGNASQPVRMVFKVDSAAYPPPVSSPTHPPQRWSREPRARFQWTTPPELSGVEGYYLILDRRAETVPTPETGLWVTGNEWGSEPLEEGTWWFHLAVKDKVGNLSVNATHYGFLVDSVAPVTDLKPLPPWSVTSSLVLSWESKDSSSGIECFDVQVKEGDGAWVDLRHALTESSLIFEGRDGGRYAFRVRGRDRVGNLEPWTEAGSAVASTSIDLSPPPPVEELKARPRARGDIELTWLPVEDSGSGTAFYRVYRWIEGEEKHCLTRDGEVTAARYLDPGAALRESVVYNYTVQAVDRMGHEQTNGNAVVGCLSDHQVGTPSVTCPTHPAGRWNADVEPVLTWLAPADASGVEGFYHWVDQEAETKPGPHRGVFTKDLRVKLDPLASGTWWFHLAAVDRAGNISDEPAHYQLCVDANGPAAPVLTSATHPDEGKWSTVADAHFHVATTPKPSGIEGVFWTLDQAPETVVTAETGVRAAEDGIQVRLPQAGKWFLHVAARDGAGTLSPTTHRGMGFTGGEMRCPVPTSPTHAEGQWVSNADPRVVWPEASHPEGVDGFFYLCDREPTTRYGGTGWTFTRDREVQLKGLAAGVWWFHLALKDKAGNVGVEGARYPLHVDAEAPAPPVITSSTHPDEGKWSTQADASFKVVVYAKPSGIEGIYWILDQAPDTKVTPETGAICTEDEIRVRLPKAGRWFLHVAVRDKAGNLSDTVHRETGFTGGEVGCPALSSPTHPEGHWISDADPRLVWNDPSQAEGVDGYMYLCDQNPAGRPGAGEWVFTKEREVQLKNLAAGSWWFHLVLKDKAGNMSPEPARWRLSLDPGPMPAPTVDSPTHPDPEKWYSSPEAKYHLTATPGPSGLEAYYYLLDQDPSTVVTAANGLRLTEGEVQARASAHGRWFMHVAARDKAGNLSPTVHRGLCVTAGDPAPPVLACASHPDPDTAKSESKVVFTWEDRTDADLAPTAYAYKMSPNEEDAPGPEDPVTTERTVTLHNVADGAWWFHVAGMRTDGRPGALTARRKVMVKRSGKVAGKFMSRDGQAPMVAVPVEAWKGEACEARTQTNADGIFVFESLPEGKYEMRLTVAGNPTLKLPGVLVGPGVAPTPMILSDDAGVYPNPPAPGAVGFYYHLKEDCTVLIEIYNDKGQMVDRLMDKKPGGHYNITWWNATTRPEGIYQYKLTAKSLTRGSLSRFTVKKFKIMKFRQAATPTAAPAQPPPK